MARLFYDSEEDEALDKAQLQRVLTALNAQRSQLRRDECGTWTIRGKYGYAATWGDAERTKWFVYCNPGTARRWNNIRRAISHLGRCTQDGDEEGIIRIDCLPTVEDAAIIRKYVGIKKRPNVDVETLRARLAANLDRKVSP